VNIQIINSLQLCENFYFFRRNKATTFCLHRNHVKSNLPVPVTTNSTKEFVQWIYLSQINQAMTMKSISDVCRVHSSEDMIDPKTSQGYITVYKI